MEEYPYLIAEIQEVNWEALHRQNDEELLATFERLAAKLSMPKSMLPKEIGCSTSHYYRMKEAGRLGRTRRHTVQIVLARLELLERAFNRVEIARLRYELAGLEHKGSSHICGPLGDAWFRANAYFEEVKRFLEDTK